MTSVGCWRVSGSDNWLSVKHANVAAIALANKTARIARAITHHNRAYDPTLAVHAV